MTTPAHASEKKPNVSGTSSESSHSTAETKITSPPKSLYHKFLPIFLSFYLNMTFPDTAEIVSPSVRMTEVKCL